MAKPIKDKNGVWRLRLRYIDPITNGWREKRLSGATKKEVKEKEIKLQSAISIGENAQDINLIAYFDTWFETYKKGNVSAGRQRKILLVRNYLNNFFGAKQTLKGVSKISYQKFVNSLSAKGLAKETVSNYHAIAKSMFLEAFDAGYIRINPTRKIIVTGAVAAHPTASTLSTDDLVKLKQALLSKPESNAGLFVLLQMMTGARYQEVAALTWDDINFDDCYIDINKAYQYAVQNRIKEPKSKAGYRTIDVDSDVLRLLKHHKVRQSQLVLSRKLRNPKGFLFVNDVNGMPISNHRVNNFLIEICDIAKIPHIHSHALRHARTDFLILSGADSQYVMQQLGHEDYNTTLKYYASLSKELKQKSRNAVRDLEKQVF